MKQLCAAVARPGVLPSQTRDSRRGGILVLAAVMLTMVFALVAFAVDIGYIATTKTELQSAADGAALAAAIEVADGLGSTPLKTQQQVQSAALSAATATAALNSNSNLGSTTVSSSDIRYGRIDYNAASDTWTRTWGATPANMVEVATRRNSTGGGGTGKLGLLFAGAMGTKEVSLKEDAVAGVMPGVGFKIVTGSSAKIGALPIACDKDSWDAYFANVHGGTSGTYVDGYSYDASTKTVSTGGDNIRELNIYPDPNANLPAGNRGTVDLGNPNNSTADLSRQIRYGLNATDMSYFSNNTVRTDTGPLIVNGDTGISAGIKDDLAAIKGEPRLMPLFTVVGSLSQATNGTTNSSSNKGKSSSSTGNNVYYRIVKFVGVRIVYVQLTGQNKKVLIQPATFTSSQVIRGKVADTGVGDTYYAKPGLLQ